jgi:uncharacterized protein (DUF697 family)
LSIYKTVTGSKERELMRLFTRKSKWDRVKDVTAAAVSSGGFRQVTKVTLGVVGGAIAASAASAAISSIRHQDQS